MSDATSKLPGFRFPASRRLRLSRDFARVRQEGRTVRGGLLMLGVLPVDEAAAFRVGLVTSKRVGGAVVRNRMRRRLREIVRRHQDALGNGLWLVVIARPAAARASSAALEDEWLRLVSRAGLLSAGTSS
jgi:ribonuclease P protein component